MRQDSIGGLSDSCQTQKMNGARPHTKFSQLQNLAKSDFSGEKNAGLLRQRL
jgi:hypothetical protein